ncbi:MAG: Gfo/Idh/MocA family oxidoreductase [Sphaerochaetaceae bacterium]|nr:Gfo/Idh/MocA family oxidoreductase [Sphaerochaetaceae bacterium]
MMALNKGMHVFCEKPPAMTVEEASMMETTAKEKGKILYYGFQNRFTPEFQHAYQKVKSGDLGIISHGKAIWLRRRGIPGWGVFTNKAIQGGGPLLDIGIHMLDMALCLMDYPPIEYVSATMSNTIGLKGGEGDFGPWKGETYTVEDSLFGQIVFKNGTSLAIETSFALNQKEKTDKNLYLYGDLQGLSLFPFEVYEDSQVTQVPMQDQDARKALMSNFINSVKGLEDPFILPSQGTYIQNLIHLLYTSAEINKPAF